MSAAQKLATLEDLLSAEAAGLAVEIVAGELVEKAMSSPAHAHAQSVVVGDVRAYRARGGPPPSGWWILPEVVIRLARDFWVRPDVSGWRRERMPVLPDHHGIEVPPDWVCEVLSPSTTRRDLGEKRAAYHEARVGHYWVVDPERRLFMVWEWHEKGYVTVLTAGPGEQVRAQPFELVEIDTDDLFAIEPPAE